MASQGTPQQGGGGFERGGSSQRSRGMIYQAGQARHGSPRGYRDGRGRGRGMNTNSSKKRPFGATDMASDMASDTNNSSPSFLKVASSTSPFDSLFESSPDSVNSQSATASTQQKANPEEKKPDFSDSEEVVTLIVGKEELEKRFAVHKHFACYYSPVLKAPFNSVFIEGQTQEYRLEDSSSAAVNFLVQWLYRQDFTIPEIGRQSIEDMDKARELARMLAELWVLADKLLVPGLQNGALKGLQKVHEMTNKIHVSTLSYVYENTAFGSPLRRYFAASFAGHLSPKLLQESPEKFPLQMVFDLAVIWGNVLPNRIGLKPKGDLAEFLVAEE